MSLWASASSITKESLDEWPIMKTVLKFGSFRVQVFRRIFLNSTLEGAVWIRIKNGRSFVQEDGLLVNPHSTLVTDNTARITGWNQTCIFFWSNPNSKTVKSVDFFINFEPIVSQKVRKENNAKVRVLLSSFFFIHLSREKCKDGTLAKTNRKK